jgi:hypothetical protein
MLEKAGLVSANLYTSFVNTDKTKKEQQARTKHYNRSVSYCQFLLGQSAGLNMQEDEQESNICEWKCTLFLTQSGSLN